MRTWELVITKEMLFLDSKQWYYVRTTFVNTRFVFLILFLNIICISYCRFQPRVICCWYGDSNSPACPKRRAQRSGCLHTLRSVSTYILIYRNLSFNLLCCMYYWIQNAILNFKLIQCSIPRILDSIGLRTIYGNPCAMHVSCKNLSLYWTCHIIW
jgi:hypothetical protein